MQFNALLMRIYLIKHLDLFTILAANAEVVECEVTCIALLCLYTDVEAVVTVVLRIGF